VRRFTILALAVAAGLAIAASPLASPSPDGLERVAEDRGFLERGRLAPVQEHAPAADYSAPGIADARIATAVAGFAGTLLVFCLVAGAGALVRRRGAPS
jgi:cobalt/nickel transport protein